MTRATELLRESTEIQMTPEGSLAQALHHGNDGSARGACRSRHDQYARRTLRCASHCHHQERSKERAGMGGRRGSVH